MPNVSLRELHDSNFEHGLVNAFFSDIKSK